MSENNGIYKYSIKYSSFRSMYHTTTHYKDLTRYLLHELREFEPPRVRTRMNSCGLFLVQNWTYLWKARARELATTPDEKSTSSWIIAEPYAR